MLFGFFVVLVVVWFVINDVVLIKCFLDIGV